MLNTLMCNGTACLVLESDVNYRECKIKKVSGVAFVINMDLSVLLPECMDKCSAALEIT